MTGGGKETTQQRKGSFKKGKAVPPTKGAKI
jgi:hypothetical protein